MPPALLLAATRYARPEQPRAEEFLTATRVLADARVLTTQFDGLRRFLAINIPATTTPFSARGRIVKNYIASAHRPSSQPFSRLREKGVWSAATYLHDIT